MSDICIIGAGLAGSEAALVCAARGVSVRLYEMRPGRMTPAHTTGLPAELICSNSLKSDRLPGAHALLKKELGMLRSPLLEAAYSCRVPAGSALAVDRHRFSHEVLRRLTSSGYIELVRAELDEPPGDCACCILAAGPLASEPLTRWLSSTFSAATLHFYDAIAPIVSGDSVDLTKAFYASRRDPEGDDYLNCPFTEEEYHRFRQELTGADTVRARPFEEHAYFEACLPVEVIASRGELALAFGPMRPVGLDDPRTGRRPFAVCQLRREKQGNESFNLVGFQTRLSIGEQQRVFRMIPALEQVEFLRFGSIHRNTYLDSPSLLSPCLSFVRRPRLFLAGQLCGSEGYTESIATGHLAALFACAKIRGIALPAPPPATALGALLRHVTLSPEKPFTPSNVHFGLFPPLEPGPGARRMTKARKKELLCERAAAEMEGWVGAHGVVVLDKQPPDSSRE